MTSFSEPRTPLEANDRRAALLVEKAKIQESVGRMTGKFRADAYARVRAIDTELTLLKAAIQRMTKRDRDDRAFHVVTDGVERMRALKSAASEVWEYVEFLERELVSLRAENERLRARDAEDTPIEF